MRELLLVLMILLLASVQAYCINICKSGQPRALIVSDQDCTPAEITAARELSKYLNMITGAYYKTAASTDKAIANSNKIYIGRTAAVEKLIPGFDWNGLGEDGIIISTIGNHLILAGARPRGTLYAVYTFLEDYLGCRWWAVDAESIPKKSTIEFDKIDHVYSPQLIYRESHYKQAYDPKRVDFATKLKLNGVYNVNPPEWGGHLSFLLGGHSFSRWISVSEYFDEHPEWFSLLAGKREPEGQLCLSNKEMRKELIKNVLASTKEHPETNIVDVSQNDNQRYCQCPECTAIAEKYGGQSGLMVDFINEIAREIAKYYPDHYVQTFAYQYTRFAPKNIVPEPNVLIRLCSIENDNSKPLNAETNKDFFEALKEWNKITKRLFIWDYIANFSNYHVPHPNTQVIEKNIKLFVENGAVGMFEQGDSYNDSVCFSHLRNWVISKLLWDPTLDGEKLIDTFLTGYYGAAADTMKQIMQLYTDAVLNANYKLTCYNSNNPYFSVSDYQKGFSLFAKALLQADSKEIRERIEVQRKGLQLALLAAPRLIKREALEKSDNQIGDKNQWCKNYLAWSDISDNTFISEGHKISLQYFKNISAYTGLRGEVPDMCKNLPEDDWFDMQDDGFSLARVGEWVFIEKDPKASDQSAARMPCTHTEWATSFGLNAVLDLDIDRADIYVRLRKEHDSSEAGFTCGLYNRALGEIREFKFEDQDISTEYKDFYIGVQEIVDGQSFWIAPVNTGSDNSILIDRVLFIRESARK